MTPLASRPVAVAVGLPGSNAIPGSASRFSDNVKTVAAMLTIVSAAIALSGWAWASATKPLVERIEQEARARAASDSLMIQWLRSNEDASRLAMWAAIAALGDGSGRTSASRRALEELSRAADELEAARGHGMRIR